MSDAEQPFLFMFGFESPAEYISNQRDGRGFESSWGVWIVAENAAAATRWGCEISEEFVRQLFERAKLPAMSWKSATFAHWISDDVAELELARADKCFPKVTDGEMPDLAWALDYWGK